MITIDPLFSFTLAIILLICGKIMTMKVAILREYTIPDPVVGGLFCSLFVGIFYYIFGKKIEFDLDARDFLLLMFFAGIGLKSDVKTLLKGGKLLFILIGLATLFIVIQNITGMALASFFDVDTRIGLLLGSIPLTGGMGTTLAWAPIFKNSFGINNALEVGIAATTAGLIAACMVGGPIAAYLMKRYKIAHSTDDDLDIGTPHDQPIQKMDYFSVLWAILIVNLAVMIGLAVHAVIEAYGITLPAFVSCLAAGIVLNNIVPSSIEERVTRQWPAISDGLSLLNDISLGLFLTMALMSLQLWQLQGTFFLILTVLTVQTTLAVLYTIWVIFPAMGRDYEATVISAGFGGIGLGSTATAVANMTAVTQQYGAAHRAFILVPLVCGFFIDIINAVVISIFLSLYNML